jgi:hypothetical protein
VTIELLKDWLAEIWDKWPGMLLRRWGMFVLDAFKGNLTLEIRATICSLNTELVIPLEGYLKIPYVGCGSKHVIQR